MNTHEQLTQWGFKEHDGQYILHGDHCRVIVEINDQGHLKNVDLIPESNGLNAPNMKCKSQLFNLLYSFDLLP